MCKDCLPGGPISRLRDCPFAAQTVANVVEGVSQFQCLSGAGCGRMRLLAGV